MVGDYQFFSCINKANYGIIYRNVKIVRGETMKITNLLKKLFTSSIPQTEITNSIFSLNSLIPLPKKEDYLNNPPKLELIKTYKNNYLKLLKQNPNLTSLDFFPKILHQYKTIYTDLLLNLCTEDNSDISFDYLSELGNTSLTNLKLTLTSIKLMLYQDEVSRLEEDTRLRIIALMEILEDIKTSKIFLINRNTTLINSILNEINNLHSSLLTFTNQQKAMQIEANSYLNKLNFSNINEDAPSDLINAKLSELKHILALVNPEELTNLENLHLSPKLFMATIEQKLEIYVYTNPEMLKTLTQKTAELEKEVTMFLTSNIPELTSRANKLVLLYAKIKNLESIYKIFCTYGRNLVSKEELKKLYTIKFQLLTYNILNEENVDILKNCTFTELECYQDIIYAKINAILKGENNYLKEIASSNLYLKANIPSIIQDIKLILKDGTEEFSAWHILTSPILLSFLLSLENSYRLSEFFAKTKSSRQEYFHLNYYDKYFDWENFLPLETIFRLMKCNEQTNTHQINSTPLYRLYQINEHFYNDYNAYILPEGLLHIHLPSPSITGKYPPEIKYIHDKAQNKTVIFPTTLKSVSGSLFENISINEIILNENLEQLGEKTLLNTSINALTFKSPNTHISYNALNFKQLKRITYDYHLDTNTLLDIIDSLATCYNIHVTDEKRVTTPVIYEEDSGYANRTRIYEREYISRLYQLVPSFDELIFLDDTGQKIIFTKEDLTFTDRRNEAPTFWLEPSLEKTPTLSRSDKLLISNKLYQRIESVLSRKEKVTTKKLSKF